jgi:hypothetical protein
MKKVLATLAIFLSSTTPVQAQIFRAYLSLAGNDANPCTLQLPCRLLPAGLAAAADGGEIWLLDSANYNTGPVTITKSVSILAVPGVVGSVVGAGGDAITIATANVDVSLQNLSISPLPPLNTNFTAVKMTNGSRLALRNCRIHGFTAGRGLWVTTPAAQNTQVTVLDSVFRNVSGAIYIDGAFARVFGSNLELGTSGIELDTTASGKTSIATIGRTTISRFSFGILSAPHAESSATRLYVTDTMLDSNTSTGILASNSFAGSVAEATVTGTFVHGSIYGLRAVGGGARMLANGNTVTNTSNALVQESGAVFETSGNNFARNNGANTFGTVTPVATY